MARIRWAVVLAVAVALASDRSFTQAQTPGALTLNQTIVFPSDAGVVNVKDPAYGAVGDGVTDDTAAILAAIANAAPQGGYPGNYISEYKIVYFPAGTYIVSKTLQRFQTQGGSIPDCGLVLIGESMSNTIVKLKDNTFTASVPVTPVIMTFSLGHTSGVSGFHNMVHNLTIDVGSGNPNATGISYLANNTSSIRNVTVRNQAMSGGSNGSGIEMNRISTGPALIENLSVNGFATGIVMQSTQCSIVLEHITLLNQSAGAIVNTDNEMVINALYTNGTGTSLVNASSTNGQRTGMIVINNSNLNRSGSSADMVSNAGVIVFHNTTFNYAQNFLGGSTFAEGTLVAGSGGGASSYQPGYAPSLNYASSTAVVDTPIVPYPTSSAW